MNKPITADGVEFNLGMSLWLFSHDRGAYELKTDRSCEVYSPWLKDEYHSEKQWLEDMRIRNASGLIHSPIRVYYSSLNAAIDAAIAEAETRLAALQEEVSSQIAAIEQLRSNKT